MRHYHDLTVRAVLPESDDARRVQLDVPDELRQSFSFKPGQHLPLAVMSDDGELRRTYSICSAAGDWPLEIGVRIQPGGAFSGFVEKRLKAGDTIRSMPPFGRFHPAPDAPAARRVAAFAAGSGITPILSIMKTVLSTDPDATVALFYGNRRQATTMFIDDLYALKNRYPERVQLHFLFSREQQEFDINEGRLDRERTVRLVERFLKDAPPDDCYVCGPDSMIDDVTAGLGDAGVPAERVHSERFGTPRKARSDVSTAAAGPSPGEATEVTVILDGHRRHFSMQRDGSNIVDAAAAAGIDLPFSCKGGVCATCRTHVAKGKVDMAVNYGLEPWEVDAGFVLACQSTPKSDELVLDYDEV
jgi:ring-1,2-phenylacetyl-CoA epoxidase subunit PaaE